ncbi:hypothetical protein [Labrenzia sp. VG12]|uniref:hypothetical protein n=1 Tax=Labrenzia sp. VG12 TaxID=2021862 RepID=UPI000B8BFCF1|nr:hypothetical protein [Labrenzia sp. VG12]ASP36050.1 hypothetical protein CHH27_24670 [Labrenzia sp. VG12]
MTIAHLEILESLFARNHWIVDRREEGDDYRISAVWHLKRPDGTGTLTVEFQGFDDLVCLPIEKSYGCDVLQIPECGLYFSRVNHARWPTDLETFEAQIRMFNQSQGW